MALFAITFRIEYDGTYSERYDSVVEALKKLRTSTEYWAETTSFFLAEYEGGSADLAAAIDKSSKFDGRKDLLVTINLTQKGYKAIGSQKDGDLDKLMARR